MKKLFLVLIVLCLTSCEIQYDGATRLEFVTKIIKSDGNPLTNSNISVKVFSSNYQSDIISFGKTDNNGNITLLFPSPSNNTYIINFTINNDDLSYLSRGIINVNIDNFEKYKFQVEPIILFKNDELIPLTVTFHQQNNDSIFQYFYIEGIYNTDFVYNQFEPDFIYPNDARSFDVKKNQIFQLNYSVFNTTTQQTTSYIVPIQILDTAIYYTLNY